MNFKIVAYKNATNKNIEIDLPSSKSISNRALILQALCKKKCVIKNLSKANDTVLLQQLLSKSDKEILDCEDAGTTFRFLLTYCSLKKGKWKITGTERLFERPIQPLLNVLVKAGADIKFNATKRLIAIKGETLQGGKFMLDGNISSQFISSLLLCGASMPEGLHLKIKGKTISESYIDMTLAVLSIAGIIYEINANEIKIEPQQIQPFKINIENDYSSAAFFYLVSSLLNERKIILNNLSEGSIQGDSIIVELMKSLGVKTSFNNSNAILTSENINSGKHIYHSADFPDLVPALVVAHAVKGIPATFHDINHLRSKESNRIESLRKNLEPYGIKFKELKNSFSVSGKLKSDKYVFDSYNDHRIAMAFAPIALTGSEVIMKDVEVVSKSFPGYWKQLSKCGIKIKNSLR